MFFFSNFRSVEKMAWDGPSREGLFPANPDLVDILGDMDLDSEKFSFLDFSDSQNLDFQASKHLDFLAFLKFGFLVASSSQACSRVVLFLENVPWDFW